MGNETNGGMGIYISIENSAGKLTSDDSICWNVCPEISFERREKQNQRRRRRRRHRRSRRRRKLSTAAVFIDGGERRETFQNVTLFATGGNWKKKKEKKLFWWEIAICSIFLPRCVIDALSIGNGQFGSV